MSCLAVAELSLDEHITLELEAAQKTLNIALRNVRMLEALRREARALNAPPDAPNILTGTPEDA